MNTIRQLPCTTAGRTPPPPQICAGHAAHSRMCREAAQPSCAMFAVAPPVMKLTRSRAVTREATPSAFARRACCADKAHLSANNCVQFDLQQHPLQSFQIQQIHERTLSEVKQSGFVFALTARHGNQSQERWLHAAALPQSCFEVSNCGARGENAITLVAAQRTQNYPHRHVGERGRRVRAARQSRARIAACVHIAEHHPMKRACTCEHGPGANAMHTFLQMRNA